MGAEACESVGLLSLPEAVERCVLLFFGEAELLRTSELGSYGFCKAAHEDTYWRRHFERRLKGAAKEASEAEVVPGDALTYFARAVRRSHLEAFRRPPASQSERLLPSRSVRLIPASRHGGCEPVMLVLSTDFRVSLHNADGEEMAADVFGRASGCSPRMASITMQGFDDEGGSDAFLLPEPAAALLPDENTPPLQAGVATNQTRGIVETKKQGRKKKNKGAGAAGPADQTSPIGSPSLPLLLAPLPDQVLCAAEAVKGGALFAVSSGGLDNTAAIRVVRADKWGDIHRGSFLTEVGLPWPQASPDTPTDHANTVTSCQFLGDGRWVAAGTSRMGTLLWDLQGAFGILLSSAGSGPQGAKRKEGRGPCFKCGESGHWAKSCPNEGRLNGTLAPSSTLAGTQAAAPSPKPSPKLSPMLESGLQKPQSPLLGPAESFAPLTMAPQLGEVVAVDGLLLDTGLLIISASATALCGNLLSLGEAPDEEAWTLSQVLSLKVGTDAAGPQEALGPVAFICALQGEPLPTGPSTHIWSQCQSGVALTVWSSASALSGRASDLVHSSKSLEGNVTSSLPVTKPKGMLCGMQDGRVLLLRAKHEAIAAQAAMGSAPGCDGGAPNCLRVKVLGGGTGKSAQVTCLAADAQLPIFLSGSADGSVKIWDSSTWQCLRTLRYFNEGAITALALCPCAPFRAVASTTEREGKLRLAWFGRKPELSAQAKTGSRQADGKAKKQYFENPGKASISEDWRGVVANSRKKDIGYGAAEFRHRGTQRKERRDLAARVKVDCPGHGSVGSSGGLTAPLFESVDVAVMRTGSTQVAHGPVARVGQAQSSAVSTAWWAEGYDEYGDDAGDYDDYDEDYVAPSRSRRR